MNEKNIFITLIVILIVVVSMMFFEGSKSIMHEDIIIKDVNSPNVHLNNILKDNYLLIDSSLLDSVNKIDILLYNSAKKYDLYVTLDCNNTDSYIIRSNLNHYLIKSHENIRETIVIEQVDDLETDFIKCYMKTSYE